MAEINIFAGNFLAVQGFVAVTRPATLKIAIVNQPLTLTQSHNALEPTLRSLSQTITFTHKFNFSLTRKITHFLEFTHRASKLKAELATGSALQLTHIAARTKIGQTNSLLPITQSMVMTRSFNGIITFGQSVTFTMVDAISLTQNPGLVSSVYVYKENNPFTVLITHPAFPQPASTVTFTFGSLVLQLRSPKIGDVNSIEWARINRRTRGGDLKIFRDPQWPRTETLKYHFEHLSEAKAKLFLSFVETTLGKDFTLTDYEGFNWTGFIKNPEALIEQFFRGSDYNCDLGFAFDMEFQGVQV